jgi:ParB family chromosome partitioning protein
VVAAGVGALQDLTTAHSDSSPHTVVAQLPIGLLEPPTHSLREHLDGIEELAASMLEVGLLQPIGVALLPSGKFRIIFGQRRLAPARLLGWSAIPCSLRVEVDEADALVAAVAENVVRRDLTPKERAAALRALGSVYERGRGHGDVGTLGARRGSAATRSRTELYPDRR